MPEIGEMDLVGMVNGILGMVQNDWWNDGFVWECATGCGCNEDVRTAKITPKWLQKMTTKQLQNDYKMVTKNDH